MNVVTYETRLTSYERTTGPLKDTYGETFLRRLISLERTNDREALATVTTLILLGRIVETTKQVPYEHYDIDLRNKI